MSMYMLVLKSTTAAAMVMAAVHTAPNMEKFGKLLVWKLKIWDESGQA